MKCSAHVNYLLPDRFLGNGPKCYIPQLAIIVIQSKYTLQAHNTNMLVLLLKVVAAEVVEEEVAAEVVEEVVEVS